MTSRWLSLYHAICMARIKPSEDGVRHLFPALDLNSDPTVLVVSPDGRDCVIERIEATKKASERPVLRLITILASAQYMPREAARSRGLRNVG